MKMITKGVLAAIMLTGAIGSSVPANAATTVYSDQALFNAAHPNTTFNAFPFADRTYPYSSYSQSGLTFTSSSVYTVQDGGFGNNKYLGLVDTTATISSNQYSAYSFNLGSFDGAQTISYIINGVAGTLGIGDEPATSFIGVDLGSSTSLNAVFNYNDELDVVSGFQTANPMAGAVPEPASWAMMILGMSVVGFAVRRRKKVTTRVAFAA